MHHACALTCKTQHGAWCRPPKPLRVPVSADKATRTRVHELCRDPRLPKVSTQTILDDPEHPTMELTFSYKVRSWDSLPLADHAQVNVEAGPGHRCPAAEEIVCSDALGMESPSETSVWTAVSKSRCAAECSKQGRRWAGGRAEGGNGMKPAGYPAKISYLLPNKIALHSRH